MDIATVARSALLPRLRDQHSDARDVVRLPAFEPVTGVRPVREFAPTGTPVIDDAATFRRWVSERRVMANFDERDAIARGC